MSIALVSLAACGGEPSPDTDPPRVEITAPTPGVVRGFVRLVADAEDNVAVAAVQFLVDGVALGAPVTNPPYETVWEAGSLANSAYALTARASDDAGNTAVSPSVNVTVVNVSTLRVVTTASGLDLDPNGYRIILDGVDVGAVGTGGFAVLPEVPIGPHTIGLADIAGNCALHLPRTLGVSVVAGAETVASFSVTCGLASGPTAERILFSRPTMTPSGPGPEQVHAVNADGSNHVELTNDEFDYVSMAWSPDRSTILMFSNRPGPSNWSLYLMNADGTEIRPVDETLRPSSASWSPDGARIVYSDATGILTIRPDGTGQVRLTSHPRDTEPAWSPDGGRIAFSRDHRLYVMNADGSDAHPVSDGLGGESTARWSPDGTKIMYVGNRDVGEEIYIIQDDGTDRRNVTNNNDLNDFDPAWSPTGDRIVYASPAALLLVPADGSRPPVPVLMGDARFNAWR